MKTSELITEKRNLENDLRAAVSKLTAEFSERSGINISSVNISMVDTTRFSSVLREYAVASATVELSI